LLGTHADSSEVRVEKPEDNYVPRDEAFCESKQQAFDTKQKLSFLHAAIGLKKMIEHQDVSFPSLASIDALFEEGFTNRPPPKKGGTVKGYVVSVVKEELRNLLLLQFGKMKHTFDKIFDFETPEVHQSTQ
jgi:lipoxygenase